MVKTIKTPILEKDVDSLKAGDRVLITGYIYTARDAAHKRIINLIERGQPLPFEIQNQIIYYVGPTPAKPGNASGSAGPTTSYRMDSYTKPLLQKGLKGMIGKGLRSKDIIDAIVEYKAVYFGAVGGAGALISKCIKEAEVIAYEDLGPEAVRKIYVEDFPVTVVIDSKGNNLYEIGPREWKAKL